VGQFQAFKPRGIPLLSSFISISADRSSGSVYVYIYIYGHNRDKAANHCFLEEDREQRKKKRKEK
jgi:hypothetical protein